MPPRLTLAPVTLLGLLLSGPAHAATPDISGTVLDPRNHPVARALVELRSPSGNPILSTTTDRHGAFDLPVHTPGPYILYVSAPALQPLTQHLILNDTDNAYRVELHLAPAATDSVTVTADIHTVDLFSPDPAEKVFVKQGLLDANPGRPGAPVSLPGYPIETASGGIKAPQYFAPGVAGDHGEPIAQYIAVGGYLLPNNLSANAHGNGYADPNILIPSTLADVEINGGAFNVLEGNHALNLAAIYGLRSTLDRSLTLTLDPRDADLVATFSPRPAFWTALEGSFGNGFLQRLEHRQQLKLNTQRVLDAGPHRLTLYGVAYYGFSFVPGLVPIFPPDAGDIQYPNFGDTVDPRQKDQTHTALLAANDLWNLTPRQQLQTSGFFRTYNLSLFSDFGQGLIRQSEFRTVTGASTIYANRFSQRFALLAGLDFQREAPRRDDLDHYNLFNPANPSYYGPFTKVDGSNITISPVTAYAAAQGAFGNHLRYYAGWRRDEIDFTDQDLVTPSNSFHQWVGVNSPKVTLSLIPGPAGWAPVVSGSFGEAFFTEDPRIGTGTTRGTEVSRAHNYELVTTKTIRSTDLKLTLGHVTTAEELAKIDPDTGLQQDQGPGRLRYLTATGRQTLHGGSLLVTFSKADARDIDSGQPTAEAPRTLFDVLGNADTLPLHLQAKAEFDYVGAKPLGTGCLPNPAAQCIGVAVREFRAALVRPFATERLLLGLNLLLASGYSGQTLETFNPSPISEITGVRIPSYASLSLTYRFAEHPSP